MSSTTQFASKVFQKPFLLEGVTSVNAVMTVTVSGGSAVSTSGQGLVMGFMLDNSGSMGEDGGVKIKNGRNALVTAIQMLRPSDEFFVIAGNSEADVVVQLCQATEANKARAISLVREMRANGGTEFSKWINKALAFFDSRPGKIHQAVLLTDGDNREDDRLLTKALADAEGHFQCECRGVQAGYKPDQLRSIAGKLLGSVDMIRDAAGITADFTAIMQKSASLAVNNVQAQIWVPLGAKITSFKQMTPEILDLTAKVTQGANAQTFRYPTGAWGGEESRDYLVTIELAKAGAPNGPKMLAGRAALVYSENGAETKVGEAQILAIWTDDIDEGSRVEPKVDNYTGQAELTKKVQDGLALRKAGNEEEATKALQRAHELAVQTGNEGTRRLLEKVVDVERDGTIKLKRNIDEADAVELDTRSSRTKRV
jgi:hypothetical protein